jgi:MFS family permease
VSWSRGVAAGTERRRRQGVLRSFFYANRRLFVFLALANFLLQFGHRIWSATFNNFAVERLAIGPDMVGWIQSGREIPGLLAIGVALLAMVFSELRIVAVSIILLGAGILLTGQSGSVPMLFGATLVMSIGFHCFGPAANGALMMSVDYARAPRILGWMRTIAAGAGVLGTLAIFFLVDRIGYPSLFLVVGGVIIFGGFALFAMGTGGHNLPERRKARFRRKYWLFYVLAFLAGSRRHILTTFAPFLLVRDFHVAVQVMSILFLVNSLINTFAHQMIGRTIARIGERWVLTAAYAVLIPVFLGYAYASHLILLFVLFAVDNVLFSFNAGLTTYIQKIAVSPEELTSNIAAQETIGHVAAVFMPAFGGVLWAFLGSKVPFLIGVGIAVISVAFAQLIRVTPSDRTAKEPV